MLSEGDSHMYDGCYFSLLGVFVALLVVACPCLIQVIADLRFSLTSKSICLNVQHVL
jgi:ABC-type sulfate transport system permease component